MTTTTPPPEIFHLSLNSPDKPTIVLLHGLFCSHLEFANVITYLTNYHILLVDLPGHSRSASTPFTVQGTILSLVNLIKEQSPTGRAHIVGLSCGGFIALELARQHSEVVNSVFASGATPFRGAQRWLAQHPRVLYFVIAALVHWCPDWLYWLINRRLGMVRHDELRVEMKKNMTMDLLRRGYGELLEVGMEEIVEIEGVRTAVVAGGLQDDVERTREMGRLLREGCEGNKAFVVRKAVHGWDLQFPELFAQGVMRWVEGENMPEAYEDLN
jgi:pimeloyl-ACP methyl ester carboxylesterase